MNVKIPVARVRTGNRRTPRMALERAKIKSLNFPGIKKNIDEFRRIAKMQNPKSRQKSYVEGVLKDLL